MSRIFRKPDRTYTEDVEEYAESWSNYAAKFEKALGLRATGFDPSVSFVDPSNPNRSIQLPVWFLNKLAGVIENEKGD